MAKSFVRDNDRSNLAAGRRVVSSRDFILAGKLCPASALLYEQGRRFPLKNKNQKSTLRALVLLAK
jgi:hypothetical protein